VAQETGEGSTANASVAWPRSEPGSPRHLVGRAEGALQDGTLGV
jgi:hypothetical protein